MKLEFEKLHNKRILITGGAGFIGGALIRKLLKESKCIIFNIDKLGYASDQKSIYEVINNNNIDQKRYTFLKVDLSHKESINDAVEHANPDIVMHLAAESHVDNSINAPERFIYSNIIGTYNLLNAIKNHFLNLPLDRKNIFKFHHISTDEVYGSLSLNDPKFQEDTNYDPRSPYSATKASSDHLVNAWHHTYGLPIVITNCSNNFGPWQFPEKLIPVVITNALSGEKIPLYGDGLNIRDWLFVEDHINALILVANKGKIGSKYCIGGFGEKSNFQVVKTICNILDNKMNPSSSFFNLVELVNDRLGHDRRYAINSFKIQNELSWEPIYNFEEALNITVDWYIRNIEWCKDIKKNLRLTK